MEIAAWANRCYIITPHQIRRFPEKVDFRTSAGFLNGRVEREAVKLHGKGPQAVVTDLGILEPDENGEFILTALHPGSTIEQARTNTGWDLKIARDLRITPLPTEEELHILREDLDPQGIYLKGAA
jgi:glutaconate CoA-transferase subunit B